MKRSLACGLLSAALCALSGCESEPLAEPNAQVAPPAGVLLARGVRRLSAPELDAAASHVVGASVELSKGLPPDTRQSDFSRNAQQPVDALLLGKLFDRAREIAEAVPLTAPSLPACAASAPTATWDQQTPPELVACAASVGFELGQRAYRRTPTAEEQSQLLGLFQQGARAQAGSFRGGVVAVVRYLLLSPSFLYVSQLGDEPSVQAGGRVRLSGSEIASELSFLVSGRPPDVELLALADAGELASPEVRRQQLARLLQQADSRFLFQRFVREWLGIERLGNLAKASEVLPGFAELRASMRQETDDFVTDVFASSGGSLRTLFAGGYSIVPSALSPLYGIQPAPSQAVGLAALGRVGILQQASFLSVFAHEQETAPVLRGKAVLERVLCRELPRPQDLGIDVVLPAPDPTKTTRERFFVHSSDPFCTSCHKLLDPVGFTFENFDAVGRLRATDAGKPVDTSGSLVLDGAPRTFRDSAELSRALAESREMRDCAARHVVRFAAGLSQPEVENELVATLERRGADRDSLLTMFLTYVQSDGFVWRSQP